MEDIMFLQQIQPWNTCRRCLFVLIMSARQPNGKIIIIIIINGVFLKLASFLPDGVELGNLHVNLRRSETERKELVER